MIVKIDHNLVTVPPEVRIITGGVTVISNIISYGLTDNYGRVNITDYRFVFSEVIIVEVLIRRGGLAKLIIVESIIIREPRVGVFKKEQSYFLNSYY